MQIDFDVDIDMADRAEFLKNIPHVPAMHHRDGAPVKHNTGVYFQNIPHWPIEGFCTIDHKTAEQQGYFKVDFLNNSVYQDIQDEAELSALLEQEPMWELLQYPDFVQQLYHIHGHSDLVMRYKPQSVEQLAMILALIRPAKKHLVGTPFEELEPEIWDAPETDEYYFKKSHAIAFATVIVVQMNKLVNSVNSFD